MKLVEHPAADQLTAFGLGKLSDRESTAIESHLAECDTCRRALESPPPDSFVALARVVAKPGQAVTIAFGPPAPAAATCSNPGSPQPAVSAIPVELANHPRYRLLGVLGVGGMGVVFKAEQLRMQRLVALKVINRNLLANPHMIERFRREAQAAARVAHPHIVHAYDADEAGDTHFLVMEYIEGISLARLMEEQGPLPVAQACDYIRQAALGLQHAFERGMVHRDLKPQNLMVARGEGSPPDRQRPDQQALTTPQLKILDFGLARFAQETIPVPIDPVTDTTADAKSPTPPEALTQIGMVMGTPDYIAPEQARDAHTADTRADIYSLGCTLYDLLCGHPPFPEGTAVQKVICHLERSPRPVMEIRADVPPELARVLGKMMAKDPDQRFQTPAEVAEALTPFSQEMPGAADHTATTAPSRRRLRFALAAFLAAVCLLAALFLPPVQEFAQTAIRGATNKGVLEIEADDQDLEITIRQAGEDVVQAVIVHKKTKRSFELTAADGAILAKEPKPNGTWITATTEFQLTRGGTLTFTARMLLDKANPTLVHHRVVHTQVHRMQMQQMQMQQMQMQHQMQMQQHQMQQKLLQGRWIAIAAEKDGRAQPKEEVLKFVQRVDFTGDKIAFTKDGSTQEGIFKLDPMKNPRWIDVIRSEGPNRLSVQNGIYEIDGNTLKLCLGEAENPRPKTFASLPQTRILYLILQRDKKAALPP